MACIRAIAERTQVLRSGILVALCYGQPVLCEQWEDGAAREDEAARGDGAARRPFRPARSGRAVHDWMQVDVEVPVSVLLGALDGWHRLCL